MPPIPSKIGHFLAKFDYVLFSFKLPAFDNGQQCPKMNGGAGGGGRLEAGGEKRDSQKLLTNSGENNGEENFEVRRSGSLERFDAIGK